MDEKTSISNFLAKDDLRDFGFHDGKAVVGVGVERSSARHKETEKEHVEKRGQLFCLISRYFAVLRNCRELPSTPLVPSYRPPTR